MLGLVARVDNGGLGTQTVEFARHMQPERIVVMLLGEAGRDGEDVGRVYDGLDYDPEMWFVHGTVLTDDAAKFLRKCRTTYVAEATYGHALADLAVPITLHANPELFRPDYETRSARIIAPTSWELRRLPDGTQILPVPVCLDRFEYIQRDDAWRFAFICGPAMLDRNGYQLLMAALPRIHERIEIEIHGYPPGGDTTPLRYSGTHGSNVEVRWFPPTPEYWQTLDTYPDVLVAPRRYGGLSLPVQEAAAQGIPSIMLSSDAHLPGLHVPVSGLSVHPMEGGNFDVYDADPVQLAATIDWLVTHPDQVARLSREARAWAEDISWSALQARYEATFRP